MDEKEERIIRQATLKAAAAFASRSPVTTLGDVFEAAQTMFEWVLATDAPEADAPPQEEPVEAVEPGPKCPKCKGPMWNNAEKKRTGEYKSTAPDYTCKDKECRGKIWPAKAS